MWTKDACLLRVLDRRKVSILVMRPSLALPESSNRTSSFLMLSLYRLGSLATTLIADEKYYLRAKHYIPSLANAVL